jgi:hypothetical protein
MNVLYLKKERSNNTGHILPMPQNNSDTAFTILKEQGGQGILRSRKSMCNDPKCGWRDKLAKCLGVRY